VYHSTLGWRVIKKKGREGAGFLVAAAMRGGVGDDSEAPLFYTNFEVANYFTEMCSGSEAGSYLRLIDFCITRL